MVAHLRSGHLKIVGSTREALSTEAVAADACTRFGTGRHRSSEPIATLCANDDIPECRSDAGRGAGKRELSSQRFGLYQSIIVWLLSLSHPF
jgi:hypothetical protein